MPVSALPSPWGIGTLGETARKFIDFLAAGGQSYWQVLPVGPTGYGDSPYQSFSSCAGNPYFIDLDMLREQGLLEAAEYQGINWGVREDRTDYGRLYVFRTGVLRLAAERLCRLEEPGFEAFCLNEAKWLDDYALFMALKQRFDGQPWYEWPEAFKRREAKALSDCRDELAEEILFRKAEQYFFHLQWKALKAYANARRVEIIGDLPIYAAPDSVEVWSSPEQFELDENLEPLGLAGCPPDGFSDEGQLWGNPLFRWDYMKREQYAWWLRRIRFQFRLFDVLRIDHFRGFDSYYAIRPHAETAADGEWRPGPGMDFFRVLKEHFGDCRFIAEDLGFLTPSVVKLLHDTGFPGMKVLEFAFDSRDQNSNYLPHTYPRNCVVYTGTHDNDTIQGWVENAHPEDVSRAKDYFGLNEDEGFHWGMMRAAWGSVADLAIVQMQDLLGLGSEARFNSPATVGENWVWRCEPGVFTSELAEKLRYNAELYERLPRDPRSSGGI